MNYPTARYQRRSYNGRMIITDDTSREAASLLSRNDPVLAPVIAQHGPYPRRPHQNYYEALVDSIISQQLSVKAARSIELRFCQLFGRETFPPAAEILTKDIEELRSAGLSRPKAMYVRDLAQHVVDGNVRFDHLEQLSNQEIIEELTAVKGIGEWTVHMFLMFCMARSDVLAYGDLGIKNGVRRLYGLDHQPSAEEVKKVAADNGWHPYETIACWYVWRSLEAVPEL